MIHSTDICATLKKMGINRNISRNIVFGAKGMGAMALRHLHSQQGIRRIQYLIGHITNNDGVGKLMRICIEAIQLEVGTFEPFFFLPYSLHGPSLLFQSWIKEKWAFNDLFNGTIIFMNSRLPHPQQTSDAALMSMEVWQSPSPVLKAS
jgi:hypothetical protein